MTLKNIVFFVCGHMATAIVQGLKKQGLPAGNLCIVDRSPQASQKKALALGVQFAADIRTAIEQADVLVLSVKPQQMQALCEDISQYLPKPGLLFISVAAGVRLASLHAWLGGDFPVVRAMPNMPSQIGCGMTGLFAAESVSSEDQKTAALLLGAVGAILWFSKESRLDAVTAVSGSGPGYVFLFMEAIQNAAVALGLSLEEAEKLAKQTVFGAANLALSSDLSLKTLREQVTSPGGTTQAGLEALENAGLCDIISTAISAANERAKALSK